MFGNKPVKVFSLAAEGPQVCQNNAFCLESEKSECNGRSWQQ